MGDLKMVDTAQPRRCFYVCEAWRTEGGGYIPALVTEDEPGYQPLTGAGDGARPWVWGQDLETAKAVCAQANTDMGVTPEQALHIVASSFRASTGGTKGIALPELPEGVGPNESDVKFVRLECRTCGEVTPEWVRDTQDRESADRIWAWDADHHDRTGHRKYYEWTVSRSTAEIISL